MNTNEKRDAGAMKFEEVQAGDKVRTRAEFTEGTVLEAEFTVTYVNSVAFGNAYIGIHASLDGRKSLSIELVSRPAPLPKVGDLLTGEQVQALPNHAVFLDTHNKPRIVFDGMSCARGNTEDPLYFHDITDPTYRLIYLPEEEN